MMIEKGYLVKPQRAYNLKIDQLDKRERQANRGPKY